jgi:putative zinc finger/helix-turn-helix YgiT family protein
METRRENHKYTECGLSNVLILDLEVRYCAACGERQYVFPRLAQLHKLLAVVTAQQAASLTGEQIRFLRKHMGWSRSEFADLIGVEGETVSRWEHGRAPMSASAERLLRLLVFREKPVEEYPSEQLAKVGKPGAPKTVRVSSNARGWNAAADMTA